MNQEATAIRANLINNAIASYVPYNWCGSLSRNNYSQILHDFIPPAYYGAIPILTNISRLVIDLNIIQLVLARIPYSSVSPDHKLRVIKDIWKEVVFLSGHGSISLEESILKILCRVGLQRSMTVDSIREDLEISPDEGIIAYFSLNNHALTIQGNILEVTKNKKITGNEFFNVKTNELIFSQSNERLAWTADGPIAPALLGLKFGCTSNIVVILDTNQVISLLNPMEATRVSCIQLKFYLRHHLNVRINLEFVALEGLKELGELKFPDSIIEFERRYSLITLKIVELQGEWISSRIIPFKDTSSIKTYGRLSYKYKILKELKLNVDSQIKHLELKDRLLKIVNVAEYTLANLPISAPPEAVSDVKLFFVILFYGYLDNYSNKTDSINNILKGANPKLTHNALMDFLFLGEASRYRELSPDLVLISNDNALNNAIGYLTPNKGGSSVSISIPDMWVNTASRKELSTNFQNIINKF